MSERSWYVSRQELEENDLNLTAGRYKPHMHEIVEYAEPGAVIAEVLQLEERISSGLKGLLEKI